jgi:hypothetical protein
MQDDCHIPNGERMRRYGPPAVRKTDNVSHLGQAVPNSGKA